MWNLALSAREALETTNALIATGISQTALLRGSSSEPQMGSMRARLILRLRGGAVAISKKIPRDYLSDTPLLRAIYGVFGVSTWPIGCDTPSAFSEHSPLGEHAKWRCDTPPQKGYLSDTCAIPYENRANGCDTPLCDTISKGYCAIWGGIPHWAAKFSDRKRAEEPPPKILEKLSYSTLLRVPEPLFRHF